MARATYVWRNGEFVEKGGPLDVRPILARSHLPAPMLIADTMADMVSHGDMKHYSSKSALRKSYKELGVEEVGNEVPKVTQKPTMDRKKLRSALKDAAEQHGF